MGELARALRKENEMKKVKWASVFARYVIYALWSYNLDIYSTARYMKCSEDWNGSMIWPLSPLANIFDQPMLLF